VHLGGVKVQLTAPDKPGVLALLVDGVEEATEDLQSVAGADTGEARMV
jgi:hypothetical protein